MFIFYRHNIAVILIAIIECSAVLCCQYEVIIKDNGPIVRGAQINFTATVYCGLIPDSGNFQYLWTDNGFPTHTATINSNVSESNWNVQYDHDIYPPGEYEVQVIVRKWIFNLVPYDITSRRKYFYLTESLNGNLSLFQTNTVRNGLYVSTAEPVVHTIDLTEADGKYISNATSITTYWFVDCVYYGPSKNTSFTYQYSKPDQEHNVEVLMIADFTPLPPPTTTPAPTTSTTTTTKPNTTTASTTVKPSSSTSVPAIISNLPKKIVKRMEKRSVLNNSSLSNQNIKTYVNGSLTKYNGSFLYVCNGSSVARDDKKTYGYFPRKVQAKVPISAVNVTGNNWLQHGDILTLDVKCQGSQDIQKCVQFRKGVYNVTGHEECSAYDRLDTCSFLIQRYLMETIQHTVIIILENDVSKVVKPVTVTVYKVKKQAQLSVIVVPVAFSLASVVLIIFGVAYYIQNRSRFIVEVADFNFGKEYSDMEYKTFRERLRESIANAFVRAPSPDPSEAPSVWPPGGRKYGSMT